MTLTRRSVLLGLTTAASFGRASLAVAVTPGEKRLVVVILRGAMDGLAVLVPHGDPALASLRGAPPEGLLDLDGFFGLHPALPNLHALYQEKALLPLHAVAGPTRGRSHFEAQDCLESGADHRMASGWLNRSVAASGGRGLAVGVSVPLLLRGSAMVGNWAPQGLAEPAADLYAAIAALNQDDATIGPAITMGLRERGFSKRALAEQPTEADRTAFPSLATAAGAMLRAPDGPRVAAMELGGWDTHSAQATRLAGPLKQLDTGLLALKAALGPAWQQTVVLVVTEFGRTVRFNGTGGTDHGTASAAFVLGGGIAGGRIRADWPGLGASALLDDRDVRPTTDPRSLAKGLLADHFGLGAAALEQVFPGDVPAMRGLLG